MLKKSLSTLAVGTLLLVGAQVTVSAAEPTRFDVTAAGLDGLSNYSGDYSDAALSAGAVRTSYQIGRGAAASGHAAMPAAPVAARTGGVQPAPVDAASASVDGLSNYSGDYSSAALSARNLRTTYRVGTGGAAHLQEAAGQLARTAGTGVRG